MPETTTRWRKKPVEVEARQWDGTADAATPLIDWILSSDGTATYECSDPQRCAEHDGDCPHFLVIRTLEGDHRASVGDWIIRGVKGEFYPCKPDIFEATYEPADAPSQSSGTDTREALVREIARTLDLWSDDASREQMDALDMARAIVRRIPALAASPSQDREAREVVWLGRYVHDDGSKSGWRVPRHEDELRYWRQGTTVSWEVAPFERAAAPSDGREARGRARVFADIDHERASQDDVHGGPEHDDTHTAHEWLSFIQEHTRKARAAFARFRPAEGRQRLVEVAALAVAALEACDRAEVLSETDTPTEGGDGMSAAEIALTAAQERHLRELVADGPFWKTSGAGEKRCAEAMEAKGLVRSVWNRGWPTFEITDVGRRRAAALPPSGAREDGGDDGE